MRYNDDGGVFGALLIALFALRAVYLASVGDYATLAGDLFLAAVALVMVLAVSVVLRPV